MTAEDRASGRIGEVLRRGNIMAADDRASARSGEIFRRGCAAAAEDRASRRRGSELRRGHIVSAEDRHRRRGIEGTMARADHGHRGPDRPRAPVANFGAGAPCPPRIAPPGGNRGYFGEGYTVSAEDRPAGREAGKPRGGYAMPAEDRASGRAGRVFHRGCTVARQGSRPPRGSGRTIGLGIRVSTEDRAAGRGRRRPPGTHRATTQDQAA